MADAPSLARKLGIAPGGTLLLLDAPAPSTALLRAACPHGVTLIEEPTEATEMRNDAERYDLIFLWPRNASRLVERFVALQWRIVPDGALWVVLLKKPIARRRGIALTWEEMQAAALQTDLVDNKIASLSDEEYGTRFVIRRERRGAYTLH